MSLFQKLTFVFLILYNSDFAFLFSAFCAKILRMKIEFSGAARVVTGSKHLLHVNGKKILLDCGLFQGFGKYVARANALLPFSPEQIDALVLSHSHIDHSGAIPYLVKKGFSAPIFATPATRDLCQIMLRDSAFIQQKEAEWQSEKAKTHVEPLYDETDVERTMKLFTVVPHGEKFFPIGKLGRVSCTFHIAGHILGSATEEWEIFDQKTHQNIRLGFTGDLGRKNLPILRDRQQIENLDFLITESTYGDRLHDEIDDISQKFADAIVETFEKKGKILIPAFAVERTQEILYLLEKLETENKIPKMPIFVDSPLAASATEVFESHSESFDAELATLFAAGKNPFCDGCSNVSFTHSVQESKDLNAKSGPMIIVSASGMCEAGRIRHHLANEMGDEKNLVLIVGFMAENTLGRKFVDGENPIKIFGESRERKAKVLIFNAFSGHADQRGLLEWAGAAGDLQNIFCVHGEGHSMEVFAQKLGEIQPRAEIFIPEPGDIFELKKQKRFAKLPYFNSVSRGILE